MSSVLHGEVSGWEAQFLLWVTKVVEKAGGEMRGGRGREHLRSGFGRVCRPAWSREQPCPPFCKGQAGAPGAL